MKSNTHTLLSAFRRHASSLSGRALAVLTTALLAIGPSARASSHSDAPLIKQDPQANLTDVYAFIRNNELGVKCLVVEVSVRPFSEPGDGVIYERFASDALYSVVITNPVTGAALQQYDFQFSSVNPTTPAGGLKNADTILSYGRGTEIGAIQSVGDARQNYTQTYTVSRAGVVLGSGLNVAPPNVGIRTTPAYNDPNTGVAKSGALTRTTLDTYTQQCRLNIANGIQCFAGPREDGFYGDTPGIFDLLDPRILNNNGNANDGLGQDGNGVDGFKGFNVLHFGIVIPLTELPAAIAYTGALQPAGRGLGVYSAVYRTTYVRGSVPSLISAATARSARRSGFGYLIDQVNSYLSNSPNYTPVTTQVNRLGNPLFNEVLVALASKDVYNATFPTADAAFATYALNPEVAVLINTVYGTNFATTNRVDLQAVYIPDVLRVNTTTAAVRVSGEAGFNRLSFIGGDTVADENGNQIPSGWPNGRRLGDDVVDIALTAVASGPSFSTITVVGDNVAANDQVYNRTFPYAGTPHAGPRNSKDSGPNKSLP